MSGLLPYLPASLSHSGIDTLRSTHTSHKSLGFVVGFQIQQVQIGFYQFRPLKGDRP